MSRAPKQYPSTGCNWTMTMTTTMIIIIMLLLLPLLLQHINSHGNYAKQSHT